MTTPKTYHVSSCIFLFFHISCFILCRSHTHSPNPFDFLKALNGTQKGDIEKGLAQLKNHLANLGYIDQTNPKTYSTNTNDDTFDDTLEQAIRKYQDFYKINVTGILDSQTVTSMLQPRCGVADILNNRNASPTISFGSSKYALSGPKWPPKKRNLTVSFPKGTRPDAYGPVKKALDSWAKVSPFRFKFIKNVTSSDVKMSFQIKDHGDGASFDGPRGVLAHSSYPPSGILHFDFEESWETYRQKGEFDLQSVALHELGHVLGLDHSSDKNAIMYAYIGANEKKGLNSDDKGAILAMYN